MTTTLETDVLIVGYGPTGATLAGLLGLYGLRVVAIDRDREIYRQPRAAHFDHEIMRVWQRLGIAEEVLPATRAMSAYEFRNARGDILMRFGIDGRETPSGWAASYMFHQPTVEEALRRRVGALRSVEVFLGGALVAIDRNDADGVAARIATDDGEKTVHARFLIGADGGGSTVRRLIDGTLFDYGFDEPWLVIDTTVTDEDGLPPYGVQQCDPQRPTTVMPMAPLRRRWEFMLKPGEDPQAMLDDARIHDLLAPWVRPGQATVVRKAVYRFHGLVANAWRKNSVLLAGDAAHQMPPFLGQGMCSGIRDAENLAWKLMLAIEGHADARLLDTYQQEREPHVRGIIEIAIAMGRMVCTLDEKEAAERDRGMLAKRAARGAGTDDALPPLTGLGAGCLMPSARAGELFPQPMQAEHEDGRHGRLDDLLGGGFWLLSLDPVDEELVWSVPLTHVVLGKELRDPSGRLEHWLTATGARSVLVRPDRYVFGTGRTRELADALRAQLAR